MVAIPESIPGADLVIRGLQDLEAGATTVESLLLEMAAPRLRALGVEVPESGVAEPAGHRLYAVLATTEESPHSAYNALIGRVVSFARAMEQADASSS